MRNIGIMHILAFVLFTLFFGCSRDMSVKGNAPGAAIEMVWISAGTFTMGSNDIFDIGAGPPHTVTLDGFYLGKYEVTQAQYLAVTKNNPGFFASSLNAGETQEKRPVENVSWYDAIEFCNKLSMLEQLTPAYSLSGETNPEKWGEKGPSWNNIVIIADSAGYRLPTEAQWEYACRAGTTTVYSCGDTENGDYMWHTANSQGKTHEVGKKLPNAWGLYDMHGNVAEWCWNSFSLYPDEAQTNPQGESSGSGRIIRGGSWWGCNGNLDQNLRSANRSVNRVTLGVSTTGFRILRPQFAG